MAGMDIRIDRLVSSLVWKYWDAFQERGERQKLRATLSDLSDRELVDIGIARGEIDYIASHRSIDARGMRIRLIATIPLRVITGVHRDDRSSSAHVNDRDNPDTP
jgi:uncharacterized protein YjiS (DUF1127 family)